MQEILDDFTQITEFPWSDEKRIAWALTVLSSPKIRDYYGFVIRGEKIAEDKKDIKYKQYGDVTHKVKGWRELSHPLYYFEVGDFNNGKPIIVLLAGVHGYEPSGVEALYQQLENDGLDRYRNDFNFLVVPVVSPWSFEYDQRWNPMARDVNRVNPMTPEMHALIRLLEAKRKFSPGQKFLYIQDNHETPYERDKRLRLMRASMEGKERPSDPVINKFVNGVHVMMTDSQDPIAKEARRDVARAALCEASSRSHIATQFNIAGYDAGEGVVWGAEQGQTGRNHFQEYLAWMVLVTEVVPDMFPSSPQVWGDRMGPKAAVETQKAIFHGAMKTVQEASRLVLQ